MMCKWVRKSFLIAVSFFTFGILFSCKTQNSVSNESGKLVIAFKVTPEEGGKIIATVDGAAIESGANVKKGSEVVFVLTLADNYTIDEWIGDGVKIVGDNTLMARLNVSANVTVEAKLKSTTDPSLKLKSLRMYNKDVDITDLNDVKVEVENFVQTLDFCDVVATFTYGSHTVPEEIRIKTDKDSLGDESTFVNLSVPSVEGRYKPWNQGVKITRKNAPEQYYIPEEVRLGGIEVALLDGKKKYEDYVSVEGFDASSHGPYASKDAKTAYVALRLKAEKPSGGDYRVELDNKTTYVKPRTFSRATGEDASYLVLKDVVLSKGYNVLEIKVKSPTSDEAKAYIVVVKYNGGPDLFASEVGKRKMLSGVYCPAQRKPLEGEGQDFVWLIGIAGW